MEITETHCQTIGSISGRVTAVLTGKSDSWSVANTDVIFEKLFDIRSNKYLAHAVGIGTLCPAGWQPTIQHRS
jgi:hypothetical protein